MRRCSSELKLSGGRAKPRRSFIALQRVKCCGRVTFVGFLRAWSGHRVKNKRWGGRWIQTIVCGDKKKPNKTLHRIQRKLPRRQDGGPDTCFRDSEHTKLSTLSGERVMCSLKNKYKVGDSYDPSHLVCSVEGASRNNRCTQRSVCALMCSPDARRRPMFWESSCGGRALRHTKDTSALQKRKKKSKSSCRDRVRKIFS